MRYRTLCIVALCSEAVLYLIGLHLERSNASLGEGIAIAITQMPGSRVAQLLFGTSASLALLDTVMFVIQTVLFSLVLCALKFSKNRLTAMLAGSEK
jgi:hypothetical protein